MWAHPPTEFGAEAGAGAVARSVVPIVVVDVVGIATDPVVGVVVGIVVGVVLSVLVVGGAPDLVVVVVAIVVPDIAEAAGRTVGPRRQIDSAPLPHRPLLLPLRCRGIAQTEKAIKTTAL